MKPRNFLVFLCSALLLVSVLMFTQLAIATTVTWSARASMPTARTWISAAVYGGKIYVFGGLSSTTKLATVERYDPGTNTWDSRGRHAHGALRHQRGHAERQDLRHRRCECQQPDPEYRRGVRSRQQYLVDGGIHANRAHPAGGCSRAGRQNLRHRRLDHQHTGSDRYTSVVEVYNPATNSWTTAAPMNTPRVGLAAAVSGGKIYVFGGYGKPPGTRRATCSPSKSTTRPATPGAASPSMKAARYGLAAASTSTGSDLPDRRQERKLSAAEQQRRVYSLQRHQQLYCRAALGAAQRAGGGEHQ